MVVSILIAYSRASNPSRGFDRATERSTVMRSTSKIPEFLHDDHLCTDNSSTNLTGSPRELMFG